MLRIALVVILFQVVLQTGCTEALCCDEIRSDIKNRTLAYNLLCSKKDPKLESCCGVIEREIEKHKLALKILCNNVTRKSCADLYKSGVRKDGVYTIDPDGQGSFKVRCDMSTDGGGWTVFQRRQDGSQDFYLGWSDYKAGFGDLNREFWLGLDKIHRLSKSGQNVLRVNLMDLNNAKRYAQYGTFSVTDESHKYRLTIGKYSGTAGDALSYHNQMKFSTKDSDNDAWYRNCATTWKGAWWYKSCWHSNLNYGRYGANGIRWNTLRKEMKKTTMKIRPNQF
ncbi:ryncolin-2-like [Dendronephthya gigantea]|uniref:ryncolin-2-like n=1 Tax=Dendronephthya gigantea TaxID=151771 RepID=UPI00106ACF50|nr:ryncolin-2-like [Dendronephthya gigantea]